MSGIDRGAHIITLTNLVPPDIFAPGNHEFDFGKATFLQRMAEAKFPLYAANLRGAGRPAAAEFQGPLDRDRRRRAHRADRRGLRRQSARVSSPEDLKFRADGRDHEGAGRGAAPRGRGFRRGGGARHPRAGLRDFRSRAVDLMLTGHTHDLFINYDGRTAMVESSYDAHYVTAIDVDIDVKEEDGRRVVTWWPQFRVIDTATVTPDPEVAAVVARFERELSKRARRADRHDRGRARQPHRDGAHARGRDRRPRSPMRMRASTPCRRRGDERRRHPRRQDLCAGHDHHAPRHSRRAAVRQPRSSPSTSAAPSCRRAIENGLSQLPNPAAAFRRCRASTIEADASRPAGNRVVSIKVGDAPLDDGKIYRVATNDFMARGGDGYTMFRDAKALLPRERLAAAGQRGDGLHRAPRHGARPAADGSW